ncbi:MAG: 5-formyltetrahydrofolate cyclo-ligase [Blautia sp.]|jgi:5-formyltetrahydrofolate cyclo-ligase
METKKEIREKIFKLRKEHTQEQIQVMSEAICQMVTKLPEFLEAEAIYAYADFNKEVITKGIIEAAWKAGKKVAVPKVHGKDMTYYQLTDFAQLAPGTFHVPEPVDGEAVNWEKALMIMPGVAFDRARHRVGYGAGYYDRYLEVHNEHPTVAVAFEFQIVEEAPSEPTDILPQKVVTEKEIYQ